MEELEGLQRVFSEEIVSSKVRRKFRGFLNTEYENPSGNLVRDFG